MQTNALNIESSKRWTLHVLAFLGLWLIATAFSITHRSDAIFVSDLASGVVLLVLSFVAMGQYSYSLRWIIALVGVWLQFAPLAFWAPMAASYINDTVVGVLVIAAAVLLPNDPLEESVSGGEVPPGWSYNPSGWMQRIPVITLAFFAWMFARLMACYQLGYLDYVWDPLFGDGTMKVITSPLSKHFPVPDAGLGAMAYTIETLMGAHGSTRRWHSIPWFVALFSLLVVPVGLTSIVLIMLQPIIVGYWCFWCLLTAICMLFMIALAIDEVVATVHYIKSAKEPVFWRGGPCDEAMLDERAPKGESSWGEKLHSMKWGITIPWNLVVSALLGLWMMFSPKIFGEHPPVSDFDHIFGALTLTFAIISMGEVIRICRYVNILFGVAFIILLFFSEGIEIINHLIMGPALILLSLPKGEIRERYGSWEKYIR